MNDYNKYLDELKRYDSEMFLGRLVWSAVPETAYVNHSEFCKTLMESGLNSILPPIPRSVDVFRRVSTEAQRKRLPSPSKKEFFNFRVVEVGKDTDHIWRQLVEELVDVEDHVIAYTPIYELRFDRVSEHITLTKLHESGSLEGDLLAAGVVRAFQEKYNLLTPVAIRMWLRGIFSSLQSITVRPSGGVYFIPETQAARLEALETVINGLPGASVHSLPLVDDGKQREMLRYAFEDDSVGEIDQILGEIGEITKLGRQISSDTFADFKVRYDGLKRKAADYSELLGEALDTTTSRLEVMDDVLFTLLGNVRR